MPDILNIPKVSSERIVAKLGERISEAKPSPTGPLGIFDSGVGGLTVLREVIKQMPEEEVLYLADSARVPYGGRSKKEIISINLQIIRFFIEHGVKMVIMGCNTSSAIAHDIVQKEFKIPIQGLITPAIKAALAATKNNKIGLIATVGTVESKAYETALAKAKKEAVMLANACPLFVPLIEGGFIEAEETMNVAKIYLRPLQEAGIDTLIFGCTHYPFLEKVVRKIMGPEVALIDPAKETVSQAKKALKRLNLSCPTPQSPKHTYFVTGSMVQFQDLGSKLLGKPLAGVKHVRITS